MVNRWIRLSRYSPVISAAASRRTPRSIFAIISLAWSLIRPSRLSIPLPALHPTHRVAAGSGDRPRPHDGAPDARARGLPELVGGAPPERGDLRMVHCESAAARDDRGRRLHLDLEPRQRGRAVDDELIVGRQLLD